MTLPSRTPILPHLLLFGALLLVGAAHGAEPPQVVAPRCSASPLIDGELNDACWGEASVIDELYALPASAGRKEKSTRVLLAHDGRWLFLGFTCLNPEMKRVKQVRARHDGAPHEDDSVEIFLDPGSGGGSYFHWVLSFANVKGERTVTKGSRDIGWNIPWRSATRRSDTGWSAEVGLPLYVLLGRGDLAETRLNVCRNVVEFGLDGIGEKTVRQRRFLSWAPVKRGFHEPESFGFLRGLDKLSPDAPFLPAVARAEVGGYDLLGERTSYRVTGQVRNFATTPGQVAVTVVDRPLAGEPGRARELITVDGMTTCDFGLAVPAASLAQRAVTVLLEDPATGEVLQTVHVSDTSPLAVMAQPRADRNYYTSEKQARVRCRFGMPAEALRKTRLVAKNDKGKAVAEVRGPWTETDLAIPLGTVSVGTHSFSVELIQADGRTLASDSVRLLKRLPASGSEVKIDQVSRVIVKDGRPFLPFGVYFNCNSRTTEGRRQHLKWLAETGFNSICNWSFTDAEKSKALIGLAREFDLCVMDSLMHYKARGESYKDALGKIVAGIEAVKDEPNLLAYYSVDEPNLVANHVGSLDAVMADCELIHKNAYEHDGYHPVFLLYARDIPPDPVATRWSDILGFDIYLTGGMSSFYATPQFMSSHIAMLEQRARSVNQVNWAVPLAERLDPRRTIRGLLPEEHRSQVYLALINGARGFFYFVYSSLSHVRSWEVLGELAGQVKVLTPYVLAPLPPQQISYTPGTSDPANRKFTDVQACLYQAPDGQRVLLAANSREYPVEVVCTVSDLGADAAVRRLFSDQALEVKDNAFSDRIAWCGVRAYALGPGSASDTPVHISLDIKAHPEAARKEDRINNRTLRVGKKNLIPNPSFERQSLPDWPDFTTPYRLEGRPAIGEPGVLFSADTDNPYHGRSSLRVTRHIYGDGAVCWGFFGIAHPPHLDAPAPYVFSLYMRAAEDGQTATVRFSGMEPGQKQFKLTTEWQRYVFEGVLTPSTEYGGRFRDRSILIWPAPEEATVWFDAFQLEAGTEATEFTVE